MATCDQCGEPLTDLKVEYYLIAADDYSDCERQTMLHPRCFLAMSTAEVAALHEALGA